MSSLTPCNYCSLNQIRRRAKERGWRVTLKREKDDWTTVYVHPSGVTDFPEQGDDEQEPASPYFAASMMKITDHCVC